MAGDRDQRRSAQSQFPDSCVQGARVQFGKVGEVHLPVQHEPDAGQVEAQIAERAHKVEPGEGVQVVQSVPGSAPRAGGTKPESE